ncbi:reductase [Rickettsia prowazekii str. NMRC Madrid E]|nr:reductase [Rickettsia prowazekii str. NMRC Madrid E]
MHVKIVMNSIEIIMEIKSAANIHAIDDKQYKLPIKHSNFLF